jgi:hypothetical protein
MISILPFSSPLISLISVTSSSMVRSRYHRADLRQLHQQTNRAIDEKVWTIITRPQIRSQIFGTIFRKLSGNSISRIWMNRSPAWIMECMRQFYSSKANQIAGGDARSRPEKSRKILFGTFLNAVASRCSNQEKTYT